jgi:steroid delta-isomerase-like uncharacterized protein
MSQENKALLQRWFAEVWNGGRRETIDELFAEDGLAHGLGDEGAVSGPEEFKEFHARFRGAFPDIVVTIEDLIAEGDKVVARCTVHGKHTGDNLGFAPTHSPVEFSGIAIVKVRDGKIVEAWNNFDFMRMNRQLGVL